MLLLATRGARNLNLQVVIKHASHVCGQHSFGLPLRMNGMHKTQSDHARFDLLPRNLITRVFNHLSSETYAKAQRWSSSLLLRSCRMQTVWLS